MYTYKDASYTDDQIKKAAEQSNMTVKEYLKKLEGDKDPEPKIKDGDLLDPNFQQDAAAGADAGSQPMTASQAGVTDLPSEDTSLDSPKTEEDLKLDNINKTLIEELVLVYGTTLLTIFQIYTLKPLEKVSNTKL